MARVLLLLLPGCVIFDTSPARTRLAELTDEDRDGVTLAEQDCNDADPLVYPGAEERCDRLDNDCDGEIDEDPPTEPFCIDADGDGRGAVGSETLSCDVPLNATASCDDCDDGDAAVLPGAVETCNEADDDCDGEIDELGSEGEPTWYRDGDGDGYGDAAVTDQRCVPLQGYVGNADDCDDLRAEVHPDQEEECNDGLDGNCDGVADPCGWSGERKVDTGSWSASDGGAVLGTFDGQTVGALIQTVNWVDGLPPALMLTSFFDAGGESSDEDPGVISIWLSPPYGEVGLESASATIRGVPSMLLGWGGSDYPVVDLDEDGIPELWIPASYPAEGFHDGGQIVGVPLGFTGDYTVSPSDVRMYSDVYNEAFGWAVAPTESLSAEGPAMLVSAVLDSTSARYAGAVHLLGQAGITPADAGARVLGATGYDALGDNLPRPRDLSQDGIDDLIVGVDCTPDCVGSWYIFHGPLSGDYQLADADTMLWSSEAVLGYQEVAEFTTWSPDGVEDLILGPWGASGGATLYVVTDYPPGAQDLVDLAAVTLEADEGTEAWHPWVATGDFDGDEQLDLAYAAYDMWLDEATADAGAVYVRYGPLSGIGSGGFRDTSDARFYGGATEMVLGHGLHAADITGDEHDELFMFGSNPDIPYRYEGGVFWLKGEGL